MIFALIWTEAGVIYKPPIPIPMLRKTCETHHRRLPPLALFVLLVSPPPPIPDELTSFFDPPPFPITGSHAGHCFVLCVEMAQMALR